MLEWVAISFSRESSWLRDPTASLVSSVLAGRFFTTVSPGNSFPPLLKNIDSWKSILKKIFRGTLSAPFWCLCQKLSLSPLYFNKTSFHKSSEQSSFVSGPGLNSSPPEAKNPGVFSWVNNNLSAWGLVRDPSWQGKDAWSSSSLFS